MAAAKGKDTSYSPGSDTETKVLQQETVSTAAAGDDIDQDAVKVLPGTGGPDDGGDIEVDVDEIHLSGYSGA